MIRLEQPQSFSGSASMAVEIEALPLRSPKHYYVDLRVRCLINGQQVLELESATTPFLAQLPLTWLEKAIKTRRKKLGGTFGDPVSLNHLICIEQYRVPEDEFSEIQKEHGAEAFPFPFLYSIDVLVNPDPESFVDAGIGMRITGLGYLEIIKFLGQIRDEVNLVWAGRSSQD